MNIMNFLRALFFGAAVVTSVNSNAILPLVNKEYFCPPPGNIEPCTCFKAPETNRITVRCANFINVYNIKAIFDRNPDWKTEDVWIMDSVMSYLPAKMLEEAHFEALNVTATTLVTLFDTTPVATPEISLYLNDVKLLTGFEWKSIANLTLVELGTTNLRIRSFGEDFKNNIPKGVQRLWFENTGVTSITNQAFGNLKELADLLIRKGSLKKVSRDMFPIPSNISFWELSYQKIADLPENIFSDMPKLVVFNFEGNLLTTISEKVFSIPKVFFALTGNPLNCNCNILWIIKRLPPTPVNGECAEPESLRGRKLTSLTAANFTLC